MTWLRQYRDLVSLQLRVLRAEIWFVAILQGAMSLGLVLGMGYLVPDISDTTAKYLVTGTAAQAFTTVALVMLPVLGFLANALLKFVWAHRLFGYCSILMAAVPNDPADPIAFHRAGQAAEINITAAKSFNRGLRSIYFALAALGWLLGPWGLILGNTLATGVLLRREFASQSRRVILMREP